jgi:DnaJ-like protein
MPPHEGEIENLAHAYRVLDAPWDASPRAIKASYRKLVKRWHPDRYPPGTESHAESTLMTRLLNEAFARIEEAPLRNGTATPFSRPAAATPNAAPNDDEPDPSGASRSEYIPRDPQQDAADFYRIMERARVAGARDDAARPFDWFGFIVRFVVGALFGVLMSFGVMVKMWKSMWGVNHAVIAATIAATILFCAFASAFGGDAFWRSIRPGGIWWSRRWD